MENKISPKAYFERLSSDKKDIIEKVLKKEAEELAFGSAKSETIKQYIKNLIEGEIK